jgi:hypothetical protein
MWSSFGAQSVARRRARFELTAHGPAPRADFLTHWPKSEFRGARVTTVALVASVSTLSHTGSRPRDGARTSTGVIY